MRTNKNKPHSQSYKTKKGNPVLRKSFSSLFKRLPPLWIGGPVMLIVLGWRTGAAFRHAGRIPDAADFL